jgi:hypothetical protein
MPVAWLRWLMADPKETDRQARWRGMSADVRAMAEKVRERYGQF